LLLFIIGALFIVPWKATLLSKFAMT
jgi:hypothetical protein